MFDCHPRFRFLKFKRGGKSGIRALGETMYICWCIYIYHVLNSGTPMVQIKLPQYFPIVHPPWHTYAYMMNTLYFEYAKYRVLAKVSKRGGTPHFLPHFFP